MKFQEIFVALRTELGISQAQLADALKISQSAIAKWELGKTEPTAALLVKIARFFDVSCDMLLGMEDEDGNKIECQEDIRGFARAPRYVASARLTQSARVSYSRNAASTPHRNRFAAKAAQAGDNKGAKTHPVARRAALVTGRSAADEKLLNKTKKK